jgi:excisionase family DNA binding protein
MHARRADTPDVVPDLHLVTIPDAAKYLAISRGALYVLLGSGQLASVHIGRARRIPMAELQRFVYDRLSA